MTAGEGLPLTNWRVGGVILFKIIGIPETTRKTPAWSGAAPPAAGPEGLRPRRPKWGPQTSLGELGLRETLPYCLNGPDGRGPRAPGPPAGTARPETDPQPWEGLPVGEGGPGTRGSDKAASPWSLGTVPRCRVSGGPPLGARDGARAGGPRRLGSPPEGSGAGPALGVLKSGVFGTPGGSWGSRLGDPPWWPPPLRVLKPPPEARPPGGPKMGPPRGGLWRARTFPYVEINNLHLTVVYGGGPGGPGTPPQSALGALEGPPSRPESYISGRSPMSLLCVFRAFSV